jgi:hypothetical protein
MAPGDFVFIDDFPRRRELFAPKYVVALACPLCGSLAIVTSIQYSARAPIVCSSNVCPGLFQIVDEARIVSLPPI